MKRTIVTFTVLLFACVAVFAVSVTYTGQENSFDSRPMLDAFYSEDSINTQDFTKSFWDDVKISLLTVSKDDVLYSWFGHTAILVEAPGTSIVYDYGRFSFGEDFYLNFAMGRLWYKCSATWAQYELQQFLQSKRTVSKVELDLTSAQKCAVYTFLDTNASEQYNTYLYHNYNDNCATRIRDLLSKITDGDFENWAKKQEGVSFRAQISRILRHSPFIMWVLDYLQGPSIDMPATLWEEMFLPENLEKALVKYGKLGSEITFLTDFRDTDTRPLNFEKPQSIILISAVFGILCGAIVYLSKRRCRPLYYGFTATVDLILGLMSCLLIFMMCFTMHDYCWNNENLVFINPLLIIAALTGISKKEEKRMTAQKIYTFLTLLTLMYIALSVLFPSIIIQKNWEQIAFILPFYIGNIL